LRLEGQAVRVAQAGSKDAALPLAMSNCQIAARPASASMPFSATLLFEPTVTYSFLPSGLR
jgi:hypothetical protein